MISSADDARGDVRFSTLEQRVLRLLLVPAAPEVPEGSTTSLRVFRAGEKYYAWLVLTWAAAAVAVFVALMFGTVALASAVPRTPRWAQVVVIVSLVVAWSVFLTAALVTFLARRLNFRLRWYIVTDRSLRIRRGVFHVEELTMTYRNIQEIRVTAGPLQHALGLATVEVHVAGGAGDSKQGGGGHVGRLEGLENANEVRDLMAERLRQYRDAGLGETPHREATGDTGAVAAAKQILDEVRELRASLTAGY